MGSQRPGLCPPGCGTEAEPCNPVCVLHSAYVLTGQQTTLKTPVHDTHTPFYWIQFTYSCFNSEISSNKYMRDSKCQTQGVHELPFTEHQVHLPQLTTYSCTCLWLWPLLFWCLRLLTFSFELTNRCSPLMLFYWDVFPQGSWKTVFFLQGYWEAQRNKFLWSLALLRTEILFFPTWKMHG